MKYLFFLLSLLVITKSCGFKNSQKNNIINEVEFWKGKQIFLPVDLEIKAGSNDTICPYLFNMKHKVLVYVDSIGCTPCKLRLFDWEIFINEVHKVNRNVSFLFYVYVNDYKIIDEIVRVNNFSYPIILDKKNEIDKLNHFSNNSMLHTLLLDSCNNVILIGNPIGNPQLKKLYIKQIIE